ncbi:MAG TPA: gamma carbonic anhydrase family protein [Treponema sp.]|nr:gamma carbonic anhydrase family protein [Treponema sp.]
MIYKFLDKTPNTQKAVFIADSAEIAGDVTLEEDVTVWFNTALRGDIAPIVIGKGTNIQEGTVLHVDYDTPVIIGDNVTIGHGAIVHGAKIGDRCLIGMGAIILNNTKIGEGSIVGAGALVTEGKTFPPKSLIIGSPAVVKRAVTEAETEKMKKNNDVYIELGKEFAKNTISTKDK